MLAVIILLVLMPGQKLTVNVPQQENSLLTVPVTHSMSSEQVTEYQVLICKNPQVHTETIRTLKPPAYLPKVRGETILE